MNTARLSKYFKHFFLFCEKLVLCWFNIILFPEDRCSLHVCPFSCLHTETTEPVENFETLFFHNGGNKCNFILQGSNLIT